MKSKYSLCDKIYWLIKTKLLYHNARLIRFPQRLRGRRYINLGNALTTGVGCRIEAFDIHSQGDSHGTDDRYKIIFGNNVQINDYVHISAMEKVYIGDNVLMASHIYISDNSHGCYRENGTDPRIPPIDRSYFTAPVIIGKNTWIGESVIIMPGVTIGEGCVIGAHSVVNNNIPSYCIAVGAPAKPIKKYNFEKGIWEIL